MIKPHHSDLLDDCCQEVHNSAFRPKCLPKATPTYHGLQARVVDFVSKSGYPGELQSLLEVFVPLALRIPSLRDDVSLMKAEVKAQARSGVQDVVTGADRSVQEKIKKQLLEKHPDWQFWGEEGYDNIDSYDETKDYLLIADPIEGTNNFRYRLDNQWGSAIALVDMRTKRPVIGIVAHPSRKRFYLGVLDRKSKILDYDTSLRLVNFSELPRIPEYGSFTYNNSPHFDEKLSVKVKNLWSRCESVKTPKKKIEIDRKILTLDTGDHFVDPESGALEVIRFRGTIFFKTGNEMAAVWPIMHGIGGIVTTGDGRQWFLGMNTLIAARSKKDYGFLKRLYDCL